MNPLQRIIDYIEKGDFTEEPAPIETQEEYDLFIDADHDNYHKMRKGGTETLLEMQTMWIVEWLLHFGPYDDPDDDNCQWEHYSKGIPKCHEDVNKIIHERVGNKYFNILLCPREEK